MPSLSEKFLRKGFRLTQKVHGEPIKILDGPEAGAIYFGTIVKPGEVPFNDELGDDLREKVTVCFPDDNWPEKLKRTNTLQDSYGQVWRVIKLVANPHDNSVDFDLQKVVEGIDEQ